MKFEFQDLPYAAHSLEPYIDAKTMEIHHSKHHRTYYDKFLAALSTHPDLQEKSLRDLFKTISSHSSAIRNNAGGYYNHNIFWQCLRSPQEEGGMPVSGNLKQKIDQQYGSYTGFQEAFTKAALTRFGSGFVWLIVKDDRSLAIVSTANQDNPLMNTEPLQGEPLLALDVWEHAYYLHYQNRRPDYVKAFWNVVHWVHAQTKYDERFDS